MPLTRALQGGGTMWLFLGGGLYTLGCVFFLWKAQPYSHDVLHDHSDGVRETFIVRIQDE